MAGDKERVKGVGRRRKGKKRNRRAMGVGREANLGNRDQKLFSSFFLPLGCFGHEPQCCGGDFTCLPLYTGHYSPILWLYLSIEYHPSAIL